MSSGKRSPVVEISIIEEGGSHRVKVDCSLGDFDEMNGRGWPVEYGGLYPTREAAEQKASRIAASVEQYKGTAVRAWLRRP